MTLFIILTRFEDAIPFRSALSILENQKFLVQAGDDKNERNSARYRFVFDSPSSAIQGVIHKKTAAGVSQPRSSISRSETLAKSNTEHSWSVGRSGPGMSRWPLKVPQPAVARVGEIDFGALIECVVDVKGGRPVFSFNTRG